jgi:hypothetical protein
MLGGPLTAEHMFAFRNYVPSKQVLWRNFASHPYPPGHAFTFFPQFFSRKEQRLLLSASLKILDSSDTRLTRRKRADFFNSKLPQSNDTDPMELFAPDDLYHFQEVSPKALKEGYHILTAYACFTTGTL